MRLTILLIVSTLAFVQVGTGCYLSIDNSAGWAFPIISGLVTFFVGVTVSEGYK